MPETQPEETSISDYPFARLQGGNRVITMKDRLSNINLALGLIGTVLGILSSVLVILSMTRPDLFKKILDNLFPGLEEAGH